MLVVIAREPRSDAPSWEGRHWLAGVDAVAWPALWMAASRHLPAQAGALGVLTTAVAAVRALERLHARGG
jgi:hypothetical protein